jgi:Major capsid protein N-terminus
MASAAAYNLLIINDVEQDKLLFNTAKLKETIAIAKYNNAKRLDKEIFELDEQISFLTNKIASSIDDIEIQEYSIVKDKLQYILSQKKSTYNNMINPSVDNIKETHEIFLNSQFKPWAESTFEYSKTSVNSKPQFGESVEFTIPTNGNFISDMVFHLKIGKLRPESSEDKVRYANMLGHKMIKKVQLFINNNLIDEYSGEYYNAYYETTVVEDNKLAWLKCIGQEIGIVGEMVPDPVNSSFKESKIFYNGLQTLKNEQGEFELFIPLLFWFNTDKKCALLNNYGTGSVKVVITLEQDNHFIACLDTISEIYNEKYIKPSILESELYTNHIFVSEEIQDIFISRIGFNLIRVHKYAEILLDKNMDNVSLLNYLKYPTEEIIIYARPKENESGIDSLNTWDKNFVLDIKYLKDCVVFKEDNGDYSIGINNYKIYEPKEIFTSIQLSFDGTSSYGQDHPNFFSSYLPLINNKTFSRGNGMYYFPYNMITREYNPSGYANLSKSKKIQFSYESDIIEEKNVKLYVHSVAINFLVFNSTSAMLNYS